MIGDDTRARRVILAAAAAGLILRLAFGLVYWTGKPLTHDEREYLALAQSLAAGRGFSYAEGFETGTAQQFGRAPGYPLFLAAIGAGRGDASGAPRSVQIAQAVVGALAIWLIGLLAMRSAGPRAGMAAAIAAALYPPLAVIPAYVLSETLFCTIALGAALALQKTLDAIDAGAGSTAGAGGALRRIALRSAVAAGALSGAAALVRPAMLFFVPLALVWLLKKREAALAAAVGAACILVLTPWTVRNLRTYDRFVLIASEGGVTFWTGNHPLARGEGDLAANPDLKAADLAFRQAHPGLSSEALEPLYYRAAFSWMAGYPLAWVSLELRKLFYLVVPIGPSYALHSARYRVATTVPYLIMLPLAVAGARRKGTRAPAAMCLLAGSTVVMSLIFFPQERFRIPTIDPMLIVAAAALAARSRS